MEIPEIFRIKDKEKTRQLVSTTLAQFAVATAIVSLFQTQLGIWSTCVAGGLSALSALVAFVIINN